MIINRWQACTVANSIMMLVMLIMLIDADDAKNVNHAILPTLVSLIAVTAAQISKTTSDWRLLFRAQASIVENNRKPPIPQGMPAVVHADICYSYGPLRASFGLVGSASHASWLSKKKKILKKSQCSQCSSIPYHSATPTLGHYGRRLRCSPSLLTRFNLRSCFRMFC